MREWQRLAQCRKLESIRLHFDDYLLLRLEHLCELLPICKNLLYFNLYSIVVSFRTFTILREWIHENMPRLQHSESLHKVKFISESEEQYFLRCGTSEIGEVDECTIE